MTDARATLPRRHFLARIAGGILGGAWLASPRPARAATEAGYPFYGEIRMFAGETAPASWMFCEGQLLAISDFDTLYSLLGTTYGGDGVINFGLPDLRGRVAMHVAPYSTEGELAGSEQVALSASQVPIHAHPAGASSALAVSDDPSGRVPARDASGEPAYGATTDTALAPTSMLASGGSAPHTNMQPYLCIHYMICVGPGAIYPSIT